MNSDTGEWRPPFQSQFDDWKPPFSSDSVSKAPEEVLQEDTKGEQYGQKSEEIPTWSEVEQEESSSADASCDDDVADEVRDVVFALDSSDDAENAEDIAEIVGQVKDLDDDYDEDEFDALVNLTAGVVKDLASSDSKLSSRNIAKTILKQKGIHFDGFEELSVSEIVAQSRKLSTVIKSRKRR